MATLKTNTLTGTSTAGSIAVTGEGNSTTTTYSRVCVKCGYLQLQLLQIRIPSIGLVVQIMEQVTILILLQTI